MKLQITIIGCRQMGISIGLALAKADPEITRVGYDSIPRNLLNVQKSGAFTSTTLDYRKAVENSDVIIFCVPQSDKSELQKSIFPWLKKGCVVLDDPSPVQNSFEKVRGSLPEGVDYIPFIPTNNPKYLFAETLPVTNGVEDLFVHGVTSICSFPSASSKGVNLAADICTLLGSKPIFSDPAEVDGYHASMEQMPQVIAAAWMNFISSQPGWRDGRRLTGQEFATCTAAVEYLESGDHPALPMMENKDNIVRLLDSYIIELQQVRNTLANQDGKRLDAYFKQVQDAYAAWRNQRGSSDWESSDAKSKFPSFGEQLSGMFLGNLGKKKKED
ncbi:MAG: NAD(P)-binding domain-containing protein [Anaerolineaceae bacterium]